MREYYSVLHGYQRDIWGLTRSYTQQGCAVHALGLNKATLVRYYGRPSVRGDVWVMDPPVQ